MANVYGYQFTSTKEPGVWLLFGNVSIGATGAPTLITTQSRGFQSITRQGAGRYTITLSDVWFRLLNLDIKIKFSAPGAPAAITSSIISETVSVPGFKQIIIQFADAAGVNVDPDSGSSLLITVFLKNSSA